MPKSPSPSCFTRLPMAITLLLAIATTAIGADPIRVLALDTSDSFGWIFDTFVLDYLENIDFDEVTPEAFASVDLGLYDVLYVPSTFQTNSVYYPSQSALDALNARAADIGAFVDAGGGVVALSEPIGTGRYTWLPLAVTASGRHDINAISVVDPAHPVMLDLTSAQLSYWGVASHNYFTDPGLYDVLADVALVPPQPVTLATSYGCGRIVITGQDPDFHFWWNGGANDPQNAPQAIFLQNAIEWAAWGMSDPVALLNTLAEHVYSLNLQNGINNSLDAKLDAALQALDDINAHNDIAACNTLQAFINAVMAQMGDKIPADDAVELIAEAQSIVDVLCGCGQ